MRLFGCGLVDHLGQRRRIVREDPVDVEVLDERPHFIRVVDPITVGIWVRRIRACIGSVDEVHEVVGAGRHLQRALERLDEAVREGKVKSGDVVLMAAFGAGLTWAGSVVRW